MGPPPSTSLTQAKQEKLVIVRGKVQTRAYVETEDSKPDGDALVALNVPEKAVYIERTQTVCPSSSPFCWKSLGITTLLVSAVIMMKVSQLTTIRTFKCVMRIPLF